MSNINANKDQRFPTRVSLVRYFLQGNLHFFVISILCSVAVSVLDLMNPKIITYTVDTVMDHKTSTLPDFINRRIDAIGGGELYGADYLRANLWMIAVIVIAVALLAACFRYANKLYNAKGAESLVQRMRNTLFSHIEHLPFTWHSQNRTGDIIQRCTSDVETIKNFLAEQLTSLVRVVILISAAVYFMFSLHVRLAAAAAVFIPIIVLYSFFFHDRIGGAFEKCDIEEGVLSNIAQENLTGVRVVRAFGREMYERKRFEKQNHEYTLMWVNLMKLLSAFWASGDLISQTQFIIVTALGAVYCVQGSLTAGQYIAFVTYNGMLAWPVRNLGRIISEMSKAGISIDRLRYIMNSEVEQDKEGALEPPMDRDIVFEDVSFRYENGSSEVLDHLNVTIKAGTTVGILGGTGSGKSTMMYLLDRLYELPKENGRITIGGVDIADIRAQYLRSNIGMVLQEPFLFSRTLSENIAIARADADMSDVKHAAGIASLDDTIERFSKGYETYVGERGVTLSGGQKQRTSIAQMLIRKPKIMVFDDSLSAVDAQTDARIRQALKEHTAESTVILIAHRITTLMQADQILVMDKGRIIEQGNHEQLMAKGGVYHKIYTLQAAGSEA